MSTIITAVPTGHALMLAAILFALGLTAVVVRRNLLFMLMGLEIMLNAAGLAMVAAGAAWAQPDGQIMFLLVLTLAAAEVSVALAFIIQLHHRRQTLDADVLSQMKG